MGERIAEFWRTRKGQDVLLVVAVVLLGVVSFGLGRLSVRSSSVREPVVIHLPNTAVAQVQVSAENGGAASEATPEIAPKAEAAQYVASKNGTVYHLPWCSGAQRIKEENKVWYSTKAEAEAAGLRPAANCKGLN